MQNPLVIKLGILSLIVGGILIIVSISSFYLARNDLAKKSTVNLNTPAPTSIESLAPPEIPTTNLQTKKTLVLPLQKDSTLENLKFDLSSLPPKQIESAILRIYQTSNTKNISFNIYNNQKLVKALKSTEQPSWIEIDVTKELGGETVSFRIETRSKIMFDLSVNIPQLVVKYP